MKKLLAVGALLLVTGCSSAKVSEKQEITDEMIKNWPATVSKAVVDEALIPDWYGNEDPLYYLSLIHI